MWVGMISMNSRHHNSCPRPLHVLPADSAAPAPNPLLLLMKWRNPCSLPLRRHSLHSPSGWSPARVVDFVVYLIIVVVVIVLVVVYVVVVVVDIMLVLLCCCWCCSYFPSCFSSSSSFPFPPSLMCLCTLAYLGGIGPCPLAIFFHHRKNRKHGFSTWFAGKPRGGGQQGIFDIFWLFWGGQYKLGEVERHQRGVKLR